MGLVLIGAGIIVFRYSSEIAVQVSGIVGTPPSPGDSNMTGMGFGASYLPFIVWGFGFSLIGAGGAMLRSAVLSPMGGGPSMGAMGPMMGGASMASPEMMDTYVQQAMAASSRAAANQSAPQAPAKEVVRIKCRNCGSLEAEDAAFCRKCGKAL
jgi:ribosomal protein L40E